MFIALITYICIVVLYVFLIKYIMMLEKTGCECSKDWRRDFIKYYFIFLLITPFIIAALLFSLLKNPFALQMISKAVGLVSFILSIAAVIIIYQYVYNLKAIKCQCSAGQMRTILEIFNYIQMILLAISLISIISTMFMTTVKSTRISSPVLPNITETVKKLSSKKIKQ